MPLLTGEKTSVKHLAASQYPRRVKARRAHGQATLLFIMTDRPSPIWAIASGLRIFATPNGCSGMERRKPIWTSTTATEHDHRGAPAFPTDFDTDAEMSNVAGDPRFEATVRNGVSSCDEPLSRTICEVQLTGPARAVTTTYFSPVTSRALRLLPKKYRDLLVSWPARRFVVPRASEAGTERETAPNFACMNPTLLHAGLS